MGRLKVLVIVCSIVLFLSGGQYVYSEENLKVEQIYKYAQALYELRDYNKAMEECLKIISLYPTNDYSDDAQYMIADCLQTQNRWDLAIENFKKLIEKYPESPYVEKAKSKMKLVRVKTQYWGGDYYDIESRVCDFYIWAGGEFRTRAITSTQYGIVVEEAEFNSAILWYRKAITEYPNSVAAPLAQYRIAETYSMTDKRNDYEKAVEEYRKLVNNYPGDLYYSNIALVAIATIYSKSLGDVKKAIEVYNEMIDRNKTDPNSYWASYAQAQLKILK